MQSLNSVKAKIAQMARLSLEMWQITHQTFMEHDLDLMPGVLAKENRLNDLEKEATSDLIELGRQALKNYEKSKVPAFSEIVGDLELIGDYCKDILERVQIKIEEKLLFSDEAVDEYNDLFNKTLQELKLITEALEKDKPDMAKEILKNKEDIGRLVDLYRKKHTLRLIEGSCSPLAGNMFLNMLDFTAMVYSRAQKIAGNLAKIK